MIIGGKRKVNKSLKAWVTFVKKVQKEEKLSYKDAIHRAKVRKDKGEKWMKGGDGEEVMIEEDNMTQTLSGGRRRSRSMRGGEHMGDEDMNEEDMMAYDNSQNGGKHRRRTMRRSQRRSSRRRSSRRRGSRRR